MVGDRQHDEAGHEDERSAKERALLVSESRTRTNLPKPGTRAPAGFYTTMRIGIAFSSHSGAAGNAKCRPVA